MFQSFPTDTVSSYVRGRKAQQQEVYAVWDERHAYAKHTDNNSSLFLGDSGKKKVAEYSCAFNMVGSRRVDQ